MSGDDEEYSYQNLETDVELDQLLSGDEDTRIDLDHTHRITPKEPPSYLSSLMNTLRGTTTYNAALFGMHYISFFISITTIFLRGYFFETDGVFFTIVALGIIAIYMEFYLLNKHYKEETYFPYCVAHNLLFLKTGKRINPSKPPHNTLYFTQKLQIFFQGYIFVIIPYTNLVRALDHRDGDNLSDFQMLMLTITCVQVLIAFISWLLFSLFYFVFLWDMTIRVFCLPCCLHHRRHLSVEDKERLDGHYFASHKSDLIFYGVYEWLYENM